MKTAIATLVAAACLGVAGAADATPISTSAGGVTYTFTQGESETGGIVDEVLVIDTTGATASGSLSSFSVQFTGASSVSFDTDDATQAGWSVMGKGPNGPSGCNINGSANHWCSAGPAIAVTAGGAGDGVYTFTFDVNMGNLAPPTSTHIQAFQGQGALAISNDVGINNNVPEPATLALFGLGLAGVGLMRRRKPV